MALPWHTLERADTEDGVLELRQRGGDEFLILIGGRVLMNSRQNRSEVVVGRWPCERLAEHPAPFVLIGGLGMGCTLRAALDVLPPSARVLVAELNPVIERWCRGPLAGVHGHALEDPRVQVEIADVCDVIEAHGRKGAPRFDAIVLDLYEGPHARTDANHDPLYGRRALERSRRALHPGGTLAVWSEAADAGFERRLAGARFEVERARPGRGGLRHAVHLARRR
jgi:spermidine synthase